jgi:hypothetical protein
LVFEVFGVFECVVVEHEEVAQCCKEEVEESRGNAG